MYSLIANNEADARVVVSTFPNCLRDSQKLLPEWVPVRPLTVHPARMHDRLAELAFSMADNAPKFLHLNDLIRLDDVLRFLLSRGGYPSSSGAVALLPLFILA